MADRDAVGAQVLGRTVQEGVPEPASAVLERDPLGFGNLFDVGAVPQERHGELGGQIATEGLVPIR